MQRLFCLLIEEWSKLVLVRRLFIDPEAHLITEPFVVVTSREQGVLHSTNINILGPAGSLKVFVQARVLVNFLVLSSVWDFLALLFLWREKDLLHSNVEIFGLNHLGGYFDLHVEAADVVEVRCLTEHLQSQSHREL